MTETEEIKCCGTCYYKEDSFNLFNCKFHNKKVAATELCPTWCKYPSANQPYMSIEDDSLD